MVKTTGNEVVRAESAEELTVRMVGELEDAAVPHDMPVAAFLAQLPYSLRRAIINHLNGDGWGTVELRRDDENWHSSREVREAVDAARDRDDCRARSTPYACGLEDGAVTVAAELGVTSEEWPEDGWATDQTKEDQHSASGATPTKYLRGDN